MVVVDPRRPCAKLARDGLRAVDVLARHAAREAVVVVVGHLDGVVDVLVWEDAQDRPEDLFASDRHLVVHVGEDRGCEIEALFEPGDARSLTAAGEPRALFFPDATATHP